jgi:phospholipid/cholesterol/gamma-HCH transport system substrate-binding protein
LPNSEETLTELNNTLVAFQGLLEDESLRQGVDELLVTSNETLQEFGGLASQMQATIAENRGQFRSILATTDAGLRNLQTISAEFQRIVQEGNFEEQSEELLLRMTEAVEEGQLLVSDIRTLVGDEELQANLKGTAANIEQITRQGVIVAEEAEEISENVAEITERGVELTDETTELVRRANDFAENVDRLVEDVRNAVRDFGDDGQLLPSVEVQADVIREADPSFYRTDLNLYAPLGDDTVQVGLYDAFESNKLNLLLKKPISEDLAIRYGVFASKPAVGVNYRVAPRIRLQSELFGLNDTQFDIKGSYDLGGGVIGWLGVERIFEDNAPALGIGVRR